MDRLLRSWLLSLDGSGMAPTSLVAYRRAINDFIATLPDGSTLIEVERDDIYQYLATRRADGHGPTTRHYRLVILKLLYKWALAEGRVQLDPSAGIKGPGLGEVETQTLTAAQLSAVMATMTGKDFKSRRDRAVIGLMLDTGIRADEVIGLQLDAVGLDSRMVTVAGKGARRAGKRPRSAPFGISVARDLDRYLFARESHRYAGSESLWLGSRGPLTYGGIRRLVRVRGEQAGVPFILHPHIFRHTWASEFRKAGGSEGDLMMLGGWKSRTMLDRYGRTDAAARAIEAGRKFSLGDRK